MSTNEISHDSEPRLPGSWPEPSTEIGPVQKVFSIFELCELILEYLPCADLCRARLVCHQFEAVINRSKIMRLRSSLRLRPNQIVWAIPNDTLLTCIYAEDHIAASKAKGHPTDELLVYELHPYLKVDHLNVEGYKFGHRPLGGRYSDGRFYGFHEVHVGDFCLTEFPDHFPLDDEYISHPSVKEIEVYMRHTHEDNLPVRNKDGIKFKDIRAAVQHELIETAHEEPWQPFPCSNTSTFIEHTTTVPRPHSQRWVMQRGPSMVYHCEQICFDYVCFCIIVASLCKIYRSTIDGFDIVIWVGVFVLLRGYANFPTIPSRTLIEVFEDHPEKLQPCGHYLFFKDGLPMTTAERLKLESIGVVTEANDPYYTESS